jgi:secreted trypsin-like serine protease
MRRIPSLYALIVAVIAGAMLMTSSYVSAITYGFVDQNNTYSNVGAFIIKDPNTGRIFPICTGTLISPTVFLTAAHCTGDFLDGFETFVSFDSPIGFGNLTDLKKVYLIPVAEVIPNPNYNQTQSDPGDIAVLILPTRSTKGITPAELPTRGLLDKLASQNGLKDAVFTAVGYGLQNRVNGGGTPTFQDANPIPRMFSFSSFDSLNGGFIRLSQNAATGDGGTCYGDSGGPNFLDVNGKRILAATTITGDTPCVATNVDYRLDTDSARNFLRQFVTLP